MSPPDPAVFVGFGAFLLFAIVVLVGLCRRERSRLDGWWHNQAPGLGSARWSLKAWEQACRESTNKSRARRG